MGQTKIEWADISWNPVTGCSKISPGCQNCYAERMSKRLAGRCGYPADEPFRVTLHHGRLNQPLGWTKPSKVFVCSMSDLFHEDVPDIFIINALAVMAEASQHIFLLLTKRPERMKEIMTHDTIAADVWLQTSTGVSASPLVWPLPNVWLGVTAENQEYVSKRVPVLLQIPAAARFVSVEPMLGPVDLESIQFDRNTQMNILEGCGVSSRAGGQMIPNAFCEPLNWVICGGESGPGARPMHPDWVRDLRDQCQAAGVPFLFKQWGEYCHPDQMPPETYRQVDAAHNLSGHGNYNQPWRVGKNKAGRLLDGQGWNQFPEVFQ